MTELPARLNRQIEEILTVSEIALNTDPNAKVVVPPREHGPEQAGASSLILNRLAAEGSAARPEFAASAGGGASLQAQSTRGASSASRVSNSGPLTAKEKDELLYILQQSDPTMTMDELEYILDGIATGRITDLSYESLRTVIETAKKYGVDVITDGVPPPPPAPPTTPTTPTDPGNNGSDPAEPSTPTDNTSPPNNNGSGQTNTPGTGDNEPPWAGEPGVGTGDPDDLKQALATVEEVQEELETVKEVIEDVRNIISKINYHIGEYRMSPAYLLDAAEVKMSREMILMDAFRKETEEQERLDEERFIQTKFQQKMDKRDQMFEDTVAAQTWAREVTDADDGQDSKRNPEADLGSV